MSEFIVAHADEIVGEVAEFTRRTQPAARELPQNALRDHIKGLLLDIAADMQSAAARDAEAGGGPGVSEKSRKHAQDRLTQGVSLDHVVSEYRTLRTHIVRGWAMAAPEPGREAVEDVARLNEVIDHAVAESVRWYSGRLEESRDLLLGVLGHDLRNPLAAISSSAYYLLLTQGLSGAQTKAASRIMSSGKRMERMVTELLDFTRTRMGQRLPITPGPANLEAISRQVVEEIEAFHPDVTVKLELSGNLEGRWDSARISQLLSNLVTNAVQYGDGAQPVDVIIKGNPEEVSVSVRNGGPPIPEEEREVIFQPLVRGALHGSGGTRRQGLGLGLYIAQQIARAHGGALEVASSEAEGTTFLAKLPRSADERPQANGAP